MKTQRGNLNMSGGNFIRNIDFAQAINILDLVDYQEGRVVSRTFAQNAVMSLTLFAFDSGEGFSSHTAAGDAFVQVLDGEAEITIGSEDVVVKAGQVVVMPAGTPHSLKASKRFKMLLVVVKAG
jgi:quercetin dioxygenase-like cupin family protein